MSADGKTVELAVPGVKPGRVIYLRSPRPFSAADGEQLWSTEVWYTANAVPGYEPPADLGFYEAEEALFFGGTNVASDHSKYSGSGFVANMTTQGSGITFTVNAAQAGAQPVHLRYSNGPNPSAKTKIVSLLVNGTEVDPLSLPSTARLEDVGVRHAPAQPPGGQQHDHAALRRGRRRVGQRRRAQGRGRA